MLDSREFRYNYYTNSMYTKKSYENTITTGLICTELWRDYTSQIKKFIECAITNQTSLEVWIKTCLTSILEFLNKMNFQKFYKPSMTFFFYVSQTMIFFFIWILFASVFLEFSTWWRMSQTHWGSWVLLTRPRRMSVTRTRTV